MSQPSAIVRVTIAENPPPRLDKALARDVPEAAALSRSRLARLIEVGAVMRAGEVMADPRARVAEGEVFEITVPEAEDSHIAAEDIALEIVYEDDALIVIDKPVGMVVHPAPGSPAGTLVNALLAHCGDTLSGVGGEKRPGVVHRIDKDTSGLLVVAKSDMAHHGLAAQFEKHTVERHYRALVHGVPDAGDPRLKGVRGVSFEPGNVLKITTQLARHKTDRQRQAVLFSGGRHAVTRARVVESFGTPGVAALLDCWLETGRTHQIRVHLAHLGHPLVGDPVYGRPRRAPACAASFARQALHARTLGFVHPRTGAALRFERPPPEDFAALLDCLRAG
jgi:23S rRNA pseudouridine1911/1915/1917 synthase